MAKRIPQRLSSSFITPSSNNINMSQFSKYPWLKQEYVDEIEKRTANVPDMYKDSMQQQMYSDYYQKQMIDDQQGQRTAIKNQARQNSLSAPSEEERNGLNKEIRKADLADLIRRKYKISTTAGDDNTIIKDFVTQIPDWVKLYHEYIKGDNSNLLSKWWIISPIFAELNEKNKVDYQARNTNSIINSDMKQDINTSTALTSSSLFDDTEYAKQYIWEQDPSYDKFIKQAKANWYWETEIASIIDANKKYQEYLKQVEEYKKRSAWDKMGVWGELPIGINQWFANFFVDTYNNLLWENESIWAFNPIERVDVAWGLRTDYDPTWQMRANSLYTKWWNLVWKIWAAILTDKALLSLLPWMQAENLTTEWVKEIAKEWWMNAVKQAVLNRSLEWAAEWGLGWFINSIWDENPQKTMQTSIPFGFWIGGLGWYIQWSSAVKDANLSEILKTPSNISSKVSSKVADKTDDANRIAGRIWQGDKADQGKVVEWVKSITKRNWVENTKSIRTYDELEKTIKKTEKQIVEEEDEQLKQFPEKIKDWTTTKTVEWIWDQSDDVTRDYIDEWIELLKKYNKNDPAALKELEMWQNAKDTEWLTRLEAKQLVRKLTSKLSKKFYNSNDELRNSMSAESYETIRKGIQNAVRDRLPDDTLKNLDLEYSNLKTFEWLTDDMTEKVNTLTQKLKEMWPIEKLGRKTWDLINRVTRKGIKWLVEKFLPSNMWNKINNSIDIETELSKNLTKLINLNQAIDTLNKSLNSETSKTALTTALNKFASVVSEIKTSITTPALTITANEIYDNTLDK